MENSRNFFINILKGKILIEDTHLLSEKVKEISNLMFADKIHRNASEKSKFDSNSFHKIFSAEQCEKFAIEIGKNNSEVVKIPIEIARFMNHYFDISKLLIPFGDHLRILPPSNSKSGKDLRVSKHRDTWLGFPKKGFNIWIPISNTPEATLEFVPNIFNKKIKLKKSSNNDVVPQNKFKKQEIYIPEVKFGQSLFFGSNHMHGSAENLTQNTRVSWDYRIISEDLIDPCKRINEFVYMDLLMEYPNKIDKVQKLTKDRIKFLRNKKIYFRYEYNSLKNKSKLVSKFSKMINYIKRHLQVILLG